MPDSSPSVRFCTVADSNYYPGLVALVNSLRIHGHDDPVTVLDLGLSAAQRAELEPECEVVQLPPGSRLHPWLYQPHACLMHPAETIVYIDSDIIVTAPLDGILAAARRGKICLFPDTAGDRWFAEWEGIFGLPGPPRRQVYVNAGFMAFSTHRFPSLPEKWAACCEHIAQPATSTDGCALDPATEFLSQDALNALLMTEFSSDMIELQPADSVAAGRRELAETRVVDRRRLECRRGGTSTTLLHSWGSPKPWQAAAGRNLRRNAYLLCLRRLLDGRDRLAVRTSEPLAGWLAPGVRGALTLRLRTVRSAALLHAKGVRHRARRMITVSS